jgi:hypothetical protein
LDVVEVVVGGGLDEGQVRRGGRAEDLAGDSGDEGVRRDYGALGDEGSGGDDRVGADVGSVQDRGADADEDVVLEGAAVDGGVVADGAAVADEDGVEVALAVEDGAVLDVGAGADADAVGVATDDGVHPEGGLGAEVDVADELGGGVDVAAGGDGGEDAAVGADHGIKYRCYAHGEGLRVVWVGGMGSAEEGNLAHSTTLRMSGTGGASVYQVDAARIFRLGRENLRVSGVSNPKAAIGNIAIDTIL